MDASLESNLRTFVVKKAKILYTRFYSLYRQLRKLHDAYRDARARGDYRMKYLYYSQILDCEKDVQMLSELWDYDETTMSARRNAWYSMITRGDYYEKEEGY
jgi:hypothetical protein